MKSTRSLGLPKPRLVRSICQKDKWKCHNSWQIQAVGDTPTEAYSAWLKKYTTITSIPRRGIWNRQSALEWYQRGCPLISSYVNGKNIVGYYLEFDLLILRG